MHIESLSLPSQFDLHEVCLLGRAAGFKFGNSCSHSTSLGEIVGVYDKECPMQKI